MAGWFQGEIKEFKQNEESQSLSFRPGRHATTWAQPPGLSSAGFAERDAKETQTKPCVIRRNTKNNKGYVQRNNFKRRKCVGSINGR